jgi:hypothetical protein
MKFSQAIKLSKYDLQYLQKLRAVQTEKRNRQCLELSACRTTKARVVIKTIHIIENLFDV